MSDKFVVEYLLLFDIENEICKDIKSFKSLIESNSEIVIQRNQIIFKENKYKIEIKILSNEKSVYHIRLESLGDNIDDFIKLLRLLQKTINPHFQNNLQKIWDDLSSNWSEHLYPKIHQTENLLRKLINKFMLVSVGAEWHKLSIPKKTKDSIKKKGHKANNDILYDIDFIQHASVLFTKYPNKNIDNLSKINLENNENLENEIKNFIPENNWDRYFKVFFDNINSSELEKDWNDLYDIRCKVAHNNFINYTELEKGEELCKKLDKILEEAYIKISEIVLSKDEKEATEYNIGILQESFKNHALDLENIMKPMKEMSMTISSISENFKMPEISPAILSTLDQLKEIQPQITTLSEILGTNKN